LIKNHKGSERALHRLVKTSSEEGTNPVFIRMGAKKLGLVAQLKVNTTIKDLRQALKNGIAPILSLQAWPNSQSQTRDISWL
jgi:hypothetical protein